MKVPVEVKQAYRKDSVQKYLVLYFPELDLTIENDQIYSESMQLTESLMDRGTVEFVGCIASCFKVKVYNLREDIKGKSIIASIYTVGTENNPIVLFRGIVDSVIRDSNKKSKEITAYDRLYDIGNTEVASWYQHLSFPISLRSLRDSLFNYIGLQQETTRLPNDDIVIPKIYDPKTLQALVVIKSICQINGVMGIINRSGKFEYRVMSDITVVPYPSLTLFPANDIWPSGKVENAIVAENVGYYRSLDFEEYTVRPVDKVTIRDNEDDAGGYYGSGENNYIIQNNMFAKKMEAGTKATMARNIFNIIQGVEFTPFTCRCNGFPWAECSADGINCLVYNYDYDETQPVSELNPKYIYKTFYILNRHISGVQALIDEYEVKGDEYQREFITDIRANVDLIKDSTNIDERLQDYTYDYDELDTKFEGIDTSIESINADIEDLKESGFANIISVTYLPANPDPNTVYLIQGYVRTT